MEHYMKNKSVIIQLPFPGFCQDFLVNGKTSVLGMTFNEYKKYKPTLRLQEVSESKFEELLNTFNKKAYLDDKPVSITEEKFDYMCDILPPENYGRVNGVTQFRMCEYLTGSITTQYGEYNEKYLQKYIDVNNPDTWLKVSDFT